MAWLEITVNTDPKRIEDTAAQLTARGFSDLVIEDQQEFESFLDENRAYWDYIDETFQQQLQGLSRIKLYLEDTDRANLARLESIVSEMGLTMTTAPMAETNWEESWKENYPPVEIGSKLVILPYWLADDYDGARTPVILDPGLTFGTGAHPTTQMVVAAMENTVKPGDRCLDLGSGSGILSIAALRLGAGHAVGVDIDPKAEDIARENAAYNGFHTPRFTALTGNVTLDRDVMEKLAAQTWEIVLVNIVADVIIGLAPVLPNFLTENTLLICSGILDTRLADVICAIERAGLTLMQTYAQEDWRCILVRR